MKLVSLDLGFSNCGMAVLENDHLTVMKIKWCDGIPPALGVCEVYSKIFKVQFGPYLDNADKIIIEAPYLLSRGNSNVAVPLIVLYNLIAADYPDKYVGFSPSLKRTRYGFVTSDKKHITRWAKVVLSNLMDMGILSKGTYDLFTFTSKQDDMADALFLLSHYMNTQCTPRPLATPAEFKNTSTVCEQVWKKFINDIAQPALKPGSATGGFPAQTETPVAKNIWASSYKPI